MKKYIACAKSSLNIEVGGLNRVESFNISPGDVVEFDGLMASFHGISGPARTMTKAIQLGWYYSEDEDAAVEVAAPAVNPKAPKVIKEVEDTDDNVVARIKIPAIENNQKDADPDDLSGKPQRVRLNVSEDDTEIAFRARSGTERLAVRKSARQRLPVLEETDGAGTPVKKVRGGIPAISSDYSEGDSIETRTKTGGVVEHESNVKSVGSPVKTIPTNTMTALPSKPRMKSASAEVPDQGEIQVIKINPKSKRLDPTNNKDYKPDADITTNVTTRSGAIETAVKLNKLGTTVQEEESPVSTPDASVSGHIENDIKWGDLTSWMKRASFARKSSDVAFLEVVANDAGEVKNVVEAASRRLAELKA